MADAEAVPDPFQEILHRKNEEECTPPSSEETATSKKEKQEDVEEEEEEEEEIPEAAVVTEAWKTLRCIYCTLQFPSPAHVMLDCGHLYHIPCFLLACRSMASTTCRCLDSDLQNLGNWGRDKRTTDASMQLPLHAHSESSSTQIEGVQRITPPAAPITLFDKVMKSLQNMVQTVANNKKSKENDSIPDIDSMTDKELQEAIEDRKVRVDILKDQQYTFSRLVKRGVTVDHFLKGGTTLIELQDLHVNQLQQLIDAGLCFRHLMKYTAQTNPEQLSHFVDCGPAVFQQFEVSADSFLSLPYTACAFSMLGLTAPALCWWNQRGLTALAVLNSPFTYDEWRGYLGLTPELATRIGISKRQAKAKGWPEDAVVGRKKEPLRVYDSKHTDTIYRQSNHATEDPYRSSDPQFAVIKSPGSLTTLQY